MAEPGIDLSESNGSSLVIVMTVFLALTWITVGLRAYTRAVLTKNFQIDDWLILVSQAVFTIYGGFLYYGVMVGIGHHNAYLEESVEVEAIKWQSLSVQAYILSMAFIKLSIGFFLLRLAATPVYIWILRISLVVFTTWSVVIFFWNIFQCSPVAKQWDFRIVDGSCVSPDAIVSAAYALTAMTIVSDFFYALLPIPMLWSVKMSNQAKLTVIMILSLGIFASLATLVRIPFLPDITNLDDILHAGTDAMVWTIVEPGAAIVASSLATTRPLLRALRIRGFESTDNKSTGASYRRSLHQTVIALRSDTQHGRRHSDPSLSGEPLASKPHTDTFIEPTTSAETDGAYLSPGGETTTPSTWGGQSDTTSVEQLHDLEAQSQDGSAVEISVESDETVARPPTRE